jgi:hypothetical protein
MRREQEAAGAARGVDDHLARLRLHALDHRINQRPRGEVLTGATLHVLRVAFEQTFVGVALHVGRKREPLLLADEFDDQLAELRRVLDLVLRLAEDQPKHSAFLPELPQRLAIVLLELHPFHLRVGEVGPAAALLDHLLLARQLLALVRHLEKEQERELLEVVLVGEPVVAQDLAVAPELLDEAVAGVGHGGSACEITVRREIPSKSRRLWVTNGTP